MAATSTLVMAELSYPMSEVRGSSQECQAVTAQEWPRGAALHLRSGTAAKGSHPTPEARGSSWEEQPHIQGAVAAWAKVGLEEPSNVESQEGWWEEIPLIQGKVQGLCFAGAAMKRYRMLKVRETQVRW